MIEIRLTPLPNRREEGIPDECLLACIDEDELLTAIDDVVERAQRELDADTLIGIARQMSYDTHGLWKHQLLEIAGRLR